MHRRPELYGKQRGETGAGRDERGRKEHHHQTFARALRACGGQDTFGWDGYPQDRQGKLFPGICSRFPGGVRICGVHSR